MSIQIKHLRKVQKAAYSLMREDARFLFSLVDLFKNGCDLNDNYVCMSLPYIGLFADGAEQWCQKVGISVPRFTQEEKDFYSYLRASIKALERGYDDYTSSLKVMLQKSDEYFKGIRLPGQEAYFNIGTDLFMGKYCGNTILCASYNKFDCFQEEIGPKMRDISVIAGKIAAALECDRFPPYRHSNEKAISPDYHFFLNSPLKLKNDIGLLLFSIICAVNYAIVFIENFYVDEIPQKFKFAYLQYYYLCEFIPQIKEQTRIDIEIDASLMNRDFRNCLAHYGLGQYMKETEIINGDILYGLTNKAFGMNYIEAKKTLYNILRHTIDQIEGIVLEI